jgi:hypothetical protein
MGTPLHTRPELSHSIVNSAAGGTLAIAAAVAGQRAAIYRIVLSANGATVLTFQDTAGTALSAPYSFAAGGSLTLDTQVNGDPWFQSGAGLGLQLNSSAAVQVSGDIYWLQGL